MKTQENQKTIYEVKSARGGWEVFDRAGRRLSTEPQARGDAVIHAKELARHVGAQVLVYGEDGKLDSEFFYRSEERPSLERDDSVASFAASGPVRGKRHHY